MTFRADTRTPDFEDRLKTFLGKKREIAEDVSGVVFVTLTFSTEHCSTGQESHSRLVWNPEK